MPILLQVHGIVFSAYDLLTRRKIHPAYFALTLILLDQTAQAKVSWTPWINFSTALQRLVA